MRKAIIAAALLLLLSSSAIAQEETPKAELFGGYSYAGDNFHGWHASLAGNFNRWLGVSADFSGNYGESIDEDGFNERQRVHSYLFGPRVSVRAKKITIFGHALVGVSQLKTELTGLGQSLTFSDTSFGFAAGGGLDINLNDHLAIRAVQLDYLRTRFFEETQNKGRVSFGIVFRFGKK